MSPETSGNEPTPSTNPASGAEAAKDNSKAESGPLRLSDIKDLSPDQKNEAAQKAIREFNAAFEGMDPNTVRAALKKADNDITLSDLKAIDELEAKVMPFLAPKTAETKAASDSEDAVAAEPKPSANNTENVEMLEVTESTENEPARQARLVAFVLEHFPDCPAEFVDQAAGICLQYEDDYRSMFEEPDLQLSGEDAQDPEISDTIKDEISKAQVEVAKSGEIKSNQTEIKSKEAAATEKQTTEAKQETEIKRNQPKVDAAKKKLPKLESKLKNTKAAIEDQKSENAQDRKELQSVSAEERAALKVEDHEEAKNETVTEDLKTVKELQSRFESMKAEKGTIGALKSLLGPQGVKSLDMKAVVKRVLGTAQSLVAAIPGKAAAVERYLNQSSVDFSASAHAQTFAGFLSLVDNSNEFTEEERAQIRQILNSTAPPSAGSAAELKDVLKNGRGTKQITEIQRVEEPPGSGNFIEKEVVVGTETIPFTKSEPYVLSFSETSPRD